MEQTAVVERFLAATYPGASVALVAGSTARGSRTPTSDIDLLLLGDALFDDTDRRSEAATHAFDGEVFEVFAYTDAGFLEWAERGVGQHRPVIVHMLVEGVPVRDDGSLATRRERWRAVLDAGPTPATEELALRRYVITDVLDDLRDATDPLERQVLAGLLFERTAELMLLSSGRWIGAGKWLPRRLRDLDPERADRLAAPLLAGDLEAFADRVDDELHRAGGRLQSGFVR